MVLFLPLIYWDRTATAVAGRYFFRLIEHFDLCAGSKEMIGVHTLSMLCNATLLLARLTVKVAINVESDHTLPDPVPTGHVDRHDLAAEKLMG
jgi:hypothetical protein